MKIKTPPVAAGPARKKVKRAEAHRSDAPRFRVFISYSHDDKDKALDLVNILKKNGLVPMWDRDFLYGQGFHEQIRNFIAHAHVFLPLLTPRSDRRKWVHQEIGYAMALGIPVLPVAAGKLPGEMIQQIHAVKTKEDLSDLDKHLSREAIAQLVRRHVKTADALYQCAEFAEARASMMAEFCYDVFDLGFTDTVRQKGGLSSFHIPRQAISHPFWQERYLTKTSSRNAPNYRSLDHCRKQREERIALELHARKSGCRIIVNPRMEYKGLALSAIVSRLERLLEFLEDMPDSKCQVAFNTKMDHSESVTIVGDWFAAESVKARFGHGYMQTIFTRHAPSLQSKIESFDQEFRDLIVASGWRLHDSRRKAIAEIREQIQKMESQIAR